jgi:hypothetical protein
MLHQQLGMVARQLVRQNAKLGFVVVLTVNDHLPSYAFQVCQTPRVMAWDDCPELGTNTIRPSQSPLLSKSMPIWSDGVSVAAPPDETGTYVLNCIAEMRFSAVPLWAIVM